MTTDPILRLVLLFVVVLRPQQQPTLEERIAQVTGPSPVDCGTFSTLHNGVALPIRPSSKAKNRLDSMRESLACAEQALKERKGFKIVQHGGEMDIEAFRGLLGTPDGQTAWFYSENGGPLATKPCPLTDVTIETSNSRNKTRVFQCSR